MMLFSIIFATSLMVIIQNQNTCAYKVLEDGKPQKTNRLPFVLSGQTQCQQYNGQLGCCDINNDISQQSSYSTLDGVFGFGGGGCDICAINLKRFWCQYACSNRQSQFMNTSQHYQEVPDPQKPGSTVFVQIVNLTVQANTACDLFHSCSRIAFVSSVSAMGSPAGFLHFQGVNAVDNAYQYINIKFSNERENSLFFSNSSVNQSQKLLQHCNYKTNQTIVHGFKFNQNCTCNNCAQSCDNTQGFTYEQASVMEGFNTFLVVIVCSSSIILSILLTLIRKKYKSKKKNQ